MNRYLFDWYSFRIFSIASSITWLAGFLRLTARCLTSVINSGLNRVVKDSRIAFLVSFLLFIELIINRSIYYVNKYLLDILMYYCFNEYINTFKGDSV